MPKVKNAPVALSISGSDPGGGAGIEADLKTFHQHGVYGMALPTLLTVQNFLGVKKVRFLDPDFLEEQWNALFKTIRPDAIKIGALGSRRMVLRIVKLLASPEAKGIPVVLDPVLNSSSGAVLLEAKALPFLINRLLPLCRIVTPNASEFFILASKKVGTETAAETLRNFGRDKPYAILLKGGHFKGDESVDLLWDHNRLTRFKSPRLRRNAHGTGCVLASSIAAQLAKGKTLSMACDRAKEFVHNALDKAFPLGAGNPTLNLWV